jgi:FAD:protein FMN transferase
MATTVTVRAWCKGVGAVDTAQDAAPREALDRSLALFGAVEAACTRFDPASPLMVANARPDDWHRVPALCFDAVEEAWRAYRMTGGRFDPRVLTDLIALGYDRTLCFGERNVAVDVPAPRRRLARPAWRPRFRGRGDELCMGGTPVDLGGIGKGLAIRWASELLRTTVPNHLVNAGGDCYCAGTAPDGGPWRVGIEDPADGARPVIVLALSDLASTTSSVRVRHWEAGGRAVHHLIDPRSGQPGGDGLAAVTVVGPDPAEAEVWSKVLFLAGRAGIASEAARRGVAACWITTANTLGLSASIERYVLWQRP